MAQRFHLYRHHDVTGVSGAGVVAKGVCHDDSWTFDFPEGLMELPPGWCELTWQGPLSSTSLWSSIDDLMGVHGHDGATGLIWD